MSVFTEKGTETDKAMTAENWTTGRHPVTIVTVSKVKAKYTNYQTRQARAMAIPSGLWRK